MQLVLTQIIHTYVFTFLCAMVYTPVTTSPETLPAVGVFTEDRTFVDGNLTVWKNCRYIGGSMIARSSRT